MVTLHKVLDDANKLSIDEQIFLEEEIHKRNLAIRRDVLLKDIEDSKNDYSEGKFKSFSAASDFLQELNAAD